MKAETAKQGMPPWLHKIIWFLLVIIVPLLAAALMIGIALQVLGVPVWQTSLKVLGFTSHAATVSTTQPTMQTQLSIQTAKVAQMTDQDQKLQAQLNDALAGEKSLQNQVSQLQAQLQGQANTVAAAKSEATVLVGMDPGAAAGVLAKMSDDEASSVVANMAPTDAGQILAGLPSDRAAKILSEAAQKESAVSAQSGNATGTGTDNFGNGTADGSSQNTP